MILWGRVQVDTLGSIFTAGPLTLDLWAVPFTIIAVVGAINTMNLIDGVDGLCGGLAIVCFGTIALLSWQAGVYRELALPMTLISAIVVFLFFNLRNSASKKVFLGDAGSMFLGFAAAWFLANASQGSAPVMSPVTALWIFAVPLIDTLGVMIRRLFRLQSPLRGDRTHLHHLLLAAGLSPRSVLCAMLSGAVLLAAVGVAGMQFGVSDGVMFAGFVAIFLVVLASTMRHAKQATRRRDDVISTETASFPR
jgi:UDP-GlcNAc:undecaprenyl-phosphate GlcNAc-1-phosphate transferase